MQGQGDTDDDLYDEEEKNLLFNKAYLKPSMGTCDDEWLGSNTVTRMNSSASVHSLSMTMACLDMSLICA